jgi:exopolyphosphatase / guanosine-5'-triphosphate,3'-diphosphate pyrophosphatase
VVQRIAAADVGSNTVHLLVADVGDGGLHEVRRVVLMPRIGAAVNATGRIGVAKIDEVGGILRDLAAVAREAGAGVMLLGATEAVRKAADREEALRVFGAAFGVPCELISGDAEARLAFRGAVGSAAPGGLALVCDIGGGSTEVVLGTAQRIEALVSLPIGSGVATDRWLADDPPTDAQRQACFDGVMEILRTGAMEIGAGAQRPAPGASRGRNSFSGGVDAGQRGFSAVATGGTATTLPVLLGRGSETTLNTADLAACRTILAAAPSADIARRYALDPARARVLAGGVEIIDAIRTTYDLDAITVTIHGLRSGMILAYAEKGDRWIDG